MTDHTFCRLLLAATMKEIRPHTTAEQRKAAWCFKYETFGDTEFHGPDNYFHNGRACCLWAERSDGWNAWLQQRPHHIKIGSQKYSYCECTGSERGTMIQNHSGVTQCSYPDYWAAQLAADKLKPFFRDGAVDVVAGECPWVIMLGRDQWHDSRKEGWGADHA